MRGGGGLTETKLFHFHRIFKNGGGGGGRRCGENPPSLQVDSKVLLYKKHDHCIRP